MYNLSYLKARNVHAVKRATEHREQVLALDVEEVRECFGDGLARQVEQQRQQLLGE
jgi:hypothetical protein